MGIFYFYPWFPTTWLKIYPLAIGGESALVIYCVVYTSNTHTSADFQKEIYFCNFWMNWVHLWRRTLQVGAERIFLSCAAPEPDIIVIFLLSFVRIFQFGYNTKSGCAMCANVCQAARVENIFPGPRTSEYFLRGIFFLVITEIHRSMHRAQSCTPTHF